MTTAETLRLRNAKRVLRGELRVRSGPNLDPGFFSNSFRQYVGGGSATLTDPYAQSEWVYSAIDAISKAVSAVPLEAVQGDPEKPEKVGGDWQKFFDDPNPRITRAQFWAATVIYYYTRAGCKWLLLGKTGPVGQNEIPVEAWPLPANCVEALDDKGNILADIVKAPSLWRITVSTGIAKYTKSYEPWQFIDLKKFNPTNPITGFLPLGPLSNAANFAFSAMTWGAAYFANNVDPGGWIENGPSTQVQVDQLKKGIYDEHGGPTKRGKLMVLPGSAKFVQNNRSQKEMEFIDGQRWSREAILAVLGVPAAVLGITNDVTFANFAGSMRIFYENTIVPLLRDYEDAIHGQLMKRVDDTWAEFDLESVSWLSIDRGEKIDQQSKLIGNGYTPDQASEFLGLGLPKTPPPIAGDDPLLKALSGDDVNTPAAAPAATVQDTALNGAQVTALQGIVQAVADGVLPAEAAKTMLPIAFPTIDAADATTIIESAAIFAANKPEVAPAEEPLIKSFSFFSKRVPRQISDRKGYIGEYLRAVLVPTETKMTATMRRYLAALQTEQSNRLKAWLKSKGLKPGDLAKLSTKDIDAILFNEERWNKAIEAAGKPHINAAIKGGLASVADEVGGFSIPVGDPRVSKLSGDTVAMLVVTNKHSQNLIRADFEAAAANGETIAELQARIARNTNFDQARALRIARTETGMASSGARFVGMEDAEVENHEWVNAGSGDIREQHQDKPIGVGGEIVVVGEKFSNGMRYPHEIGSDASDVCNCRCEALGVL